LHFREARYNDEVYLTQKLKSGIRDSFTAYEMLDNGLDGSGVSK